MGREPEHLGLWQGASLGSIRAGLASSPEAASKLTAFYTSALGRAPTASELAANEGSLAGTTSLGTVESWVAYGTEATGDIGASYQQVLGRAPNASELGGAQYQLWQGASQASIRAGLASSPEAIAKLTAFYTAALGRAPTAAELAANEGSLAGTTSLSTVESWVAYGTEAQADIGAMYQRELGRTVDSASLGSAEYQLWQGASLASLTQTTAYSPESQADITNCLSGLDVPAAALSTFLGDAEAGLAAGQNVAACVANLVVEGVVNNLITQIDTDLNATAATIASDISSLGSQLVSDIDAIPGTVVTWGETAATLGLDVMRFIAGKFVSEPGNQTTLTAQQTKTYQDVSAAAGQNGTVSPPAGTTLIDGSPLLTSFCSIFSPNDPSYHQYPVEFRISNGTQEISQQQATQYLGRVIIPGGGIASSPVQNNALNSVYQSGVFIGYVRTYVEPGTNTYVNATVSGHLFDTGVAGLTVIETSGYTLLEI